MEGKRHPGVTGATIIFATVLSFSTTSYVLGAQLSLSITSGSLQASATFDVSGPNLIVTLANTSDNDVLIPDHVLTALFFDIDPMATVSLTPVDAILGAGSIVHFGSTGPGNSVAGEWAYKDSLTGAPFNVAYGISSSGFGLFGKNDRFGTTSLQGPDSPDGLQYGITSAGDNLTTGNAHVTGTEALIQNEVIFTLAGLPAGFDPETQIKNVVWQYGTDLSEPTVSNLPEPATLVLFTLTALTLSPRRRRPPATIKT